MTDHAGPAPPLLRLPRELHGDRIPMGPTDLTSKKRRALERETMLLIDPSWKRPPKKRHSQAILLVHSHLFMAGLMTYWSGNTFVFGDCDKLRGSFSVALSETVNNITSIELGETYHFFSDHDDPDDEYDWDLFSSNPHRRSILRKPDCDQWWPHPSWPASLEILAMLPQLCRLDLHVGLLTERESVPAQGVTNWDRASHDHRDRPLERKSTLYLRDQVLLSIPLGTLDKLQSLKMISHLQIGPYPLNHVKFCAEVLPYTKDLHSGAWNVPPSRPNSNLGLQVAPPDWRLHKRWLEARAAVYCDDTVEQSVQVGSEDSLYNGLERTTLQWCSWAREWSGEHWGIDARSPEWLGRPRSKEEMANEYAILRGTEKKPQNE
ncbi:hypothetical protein LTR91_000822 [Friedmanniomyces endolithicus]|uniref:Uncharacterized protein n=1 Tax=Friedmanniomyces endolithicus TaxID=329885 RepID=A0AAN6R290_9PEZI|nr:hypothetical protein LTR91_000822 [Friedmanniomyces endolithicus]